MVLQIRRSYEANTQLSPKMRDQLSGLSIVKKDLAVRLKGKRYERRTEPRPCWLIVQMKSHASRAKKRLFCNSGFQLDKIEVEMLSIITSRYH
jgi:hypothetical protein